LDAIHLWPSQWPGSSVININTMNALHFAMFRSVTALANTAFYGTDKEYWYDYDFMGVWGDGRPINPASISHDDVLTRALWP